ncbi:hypothetical protein AB1I63_05530 [Streptococcus pneumoniae]
MHQYTNLEILAMQLVNHTIDKIVVYQPHLIATRIYKSLLDFTTALLENYKTVET